MPKLYKAGDEPVKGYVLQKSLGEGGVGETWRARGPGGIEVALKIVDKLQERAGIRDLQGLELVKNIRHVHLCTLQSFWIKDADGREIRSDELNLDGDALTETAHPDRDPLEAVELFLAMELGDETLTDAFKRHPTGMPVQELYRYIEGAGKAVDYLNQHHKICHCDLKPDNIILVSGEAKVCDFGLAREVFDPQKTSSVAMTPQYGAPEMIGREYHPRMDQYSLALVYAYLRTGYFPFPSFSRIRSWSELKLLENEKKGEKFDLSRLPESERRVVAKALSFRPEKRYDNIAEFLKALKQAVFQPETFRKSRSRFGRLSQFAVVLVLLATIGYLGWSAGPPQPENGVAEVRRFLESHDQTGNPQYLKNAVDSLQQLITQGESSAELEELEWDCLDRFLELAESPLKAREVDEASTYLDVINNHLTQHPQRVSHPLPVRYNLAFARRAAYGQYWEEVEELLQAVPCDSEPLSPPDQAWFLLLQLQAAQQRRPESPIEPAELQQLQQLRKVRDELEEPEREVVKHLETHALRRIPDAPPEHQRELIGELWPNLLFDRLFARIYDTAQAGDAIAPACLDELNRLAETRQERNHVALLEFLVDQLEPMDAAAFSEAVSRLRPLLEMREETGSKLETLELFEFLVTRLETNRQVVPAEHTTMQDLWEKWESFLAGQRISAGSLDARLRVLAVTAAVSVDPPDYVALETLVRPLIDAWFPSEAPEDVDRDEEEVQRAPLIVAAWLESALEQGREFDLQSDPAWHAALAWWRQDHPANELADYVGYVQAFERSELQGEPRQAAERLMEIAADSPGLEVTRRRDRALRILLEGVQSARRSADGFSARVFGEDAVWARDALQLARNYWDGTRTTPRERDDLKENLILALAESGREPADWFGILEKLLERRSGARLLGVRLEGARRMFEQNPGDPAAEAALLRAYADLLAWIDEPGRSPRFTEFRDEFLDAAWQQVQTIPLIAAVANLELPELWQLLPLPDPSSPFAEQIAAVPERRSVAAICAFQAKRLQREFDFGPAGLLSRLHVLAVASWLARDGAEYHVELAETLRHVPDQDAGEVLFKVESLAGTAATVGADFHGVLGLQAYVELMRARLATDRGARLQHQENAITYYQQALDRNPPAAFRARYLVGSSTAHLESAFFLPQELDNPRQQQELRFERARRLAEQATRIRDAIDPPDLAWVAKGHAEEDLAYFLGHHDRFEQARESFTTAFNRAPEGRRRALAALARGRSRFRELKREVAEGRRPISTNEQLDEQLENEVLPDLALAIQSGHDTRIGAEASYWKSEVFLYRVRNRGLAELTNRNSKQDLALADRYCGEAVRLAWNVAPGDWPRYKRSWVRIGLHRHWHHDDISSREIKQRAEDFLDVARAPRSEMAISPSEEFDVMVVYFRLVSPIEARRERIGSCLDRFPAEAPDRVMFRSMLLGQRSYWTLEQVGPNDSLFQEAKEDAAEALTLAQQAPRDHVAHDRALGLAYGVRGLWFARRFFHDIQSDAQGFYWANSASRDLRAAFRHYRQYQQQGGSLSALSCEHKYVRICDTLGSIHIFLLRNYDEEFISEPKDALAEAAIQALESFDLHGEEQRKRIGENLKELRSHLP